MALQSTCFRIVALATLIAVVGLMATAKRSPAQPQDKPPQAEPAQDKPSQEEADRRVADSFQARVKPFLSKYCLRCHNADEMMSGIRVDRLDGTLKDRYLRLWEGIQSQLDDEAMPPEDELQPSAKERESISQWIDAALATARSRKTAKNGSVRRLTVAQYRNTLRELLGLDDDFTDVLPADALSKDGFLNNEEAMQLSPLLLEAYFDIANKALDRCLVDERSRPSIQNFRMDLGEDVNPEPCPDKLILGALSHLLRNQNFMVTQLEPRKPFDYEPYFMRTKYRFIEGYQGNATVRGWREYDSIYHAVFACMRGNMGYPKGRAYEAIPEGLLLRPAIPSAELFQVESTYGPRANFKISLRELPDTGRFRVTVRAAKYDDGLLLDSVAKSPKDAGASVFAEHLEATQEVMIKQAGVYRVDVYGNAPLDPVQPDATRLTDALIGHWRFDDDLKGGSGDLPLEGALSGEAKTVDSPFGKAVSFQGKDSAFVAPRHEAMNVADGEFTVSAWIRPSNLQQGGIVCLGGYGYTHGWIFDMPNDKGVLRLETADANHSANGTVASRPGVIQANRWQHVAVVVRRGENQTRLFVNGYEVGIGTIGAKDLDNPKVSLHIGRVQNANLFRGEIDEVRIYRRALAVAELKALLEPGKQFAAPPPEKPQELTLQIGDRRFSGQLRQPAFLALRLPSGPLGISGRFADGSYPGRAVLTRLEEGDELAREFLRFERRSPRVGVHLGLRRDCGSTLAPAGPPQSVASTDLKDYVFEGAISNFPSPDVEKDNVNYLAGIREIGVRSEYTDGREMPRLLIRSVEFEGPYYDSWPPSTHRNIFIESSHPKRSPEYALEILRNFGSRAFRRPLTNSEEELLFSVWKDSFSETQDFQQSVKDALLVVLTSPQFLFLIEASDSPKAEPLESWELASKLSYFLWNGPPDARLRSLALEDALHDALDKELTRMVDDAKFDAFAHEFTSQWLNLEKLDVLEVDRKRYPKLTRDTKTQLRREPEQFLRHLFRKNLSLRHLIQSDFVMANEVVASYYGLGERSESGFDFEPIRHGSQHLGGVLSQAGILAGLSDGREANPVKRGAWLARKIIAEPPDDPPPNVPALPEDNRDRPLRERLERHRNQPGCVKCHAGIDPWGVALQQYDAGGLFTGGGKIDARSTLPDATIVADANDLREYLVKDRIDQVAFSFLKHLTTYAIGRSLTYNEIELLKEKTLELKPRGYRMRDLLRFVVTSEMFLEK